VRLSGRMSATTRSSTHVAPGSGTRDDGDAVLGGARTVASERQSAAERRSATPGSAALATSLAAGGRQQVPKAELAAPLSTLHPAFLNQLPALSARNDRGQAWQVRRVLTRHRPSVKTPGGESWADGLVVSPVGNPKVGVLVQFQGFLPDILPDYTLIPGSVCLSSEEESAVERVLMSWNLEDPNSLRNLLDAMLPSPAPEVPVCRAQANPELLPTASLVKSPTSDSADQTLLPGRTEQTLSSQEATEQDVDSDSTLPMPEDRTRSVPVDTAIHVYESSRLTPAEGAAATPRLILADAVGAPNPSVSKVANHSNSRAIDEKPEVSRSSIGVPPAVSVAQPYAAGVARQPGHAEQTVKAEPPEHNPIAAGGDLLKRLGPGKRRKIFLEEDVDNSNATAARNGEDLFAKCMKH